MTWLIINPKLVAEIAQNRNVFSSKKPVPKVKWLVEKQPPESGQIPTPEKTSADLESMAANWRQYLPMIKDSKSNA